MKKGALCRVSVVLCLMMLLVATGVLAAPAAWRPGLAALADPVIRFSPSSGGTGRAAAELGPNMDQGASASLLGTVDLTLSPPTQAAVVGDIFTIDLTVVAGTQQVDGVDTYIQFDPAVLTVVDSSGNPVAAIENDLSALTSELYNWVDSGGVIYYSAGILVGTPPSGTFRIAMIRFKKIAVASLTTVRYVAPSDVSFAGVSVLGALGSATVTHPGMPTPTPTSQRSRVYLPLVR